MTLFDYFFKKLKEKKSLFVSINDFADDEVVEVEILEVENDFVTVKAKVDGGKDPESGIPYLVHKTIKVPFTSINYIEDPEDNK